MSFDNPFRENRLNHSGNYRPEWDVLEMNREVTDALVAEVRRLRGRKEPDPGQMIVTILGPAGYGKTHLFGRIEHTIGHEVFFVFVPAFQAGTEPIDHIRWHVVESLFRVREGSHSPLEMALARTCRPALAEYFSELPPTLLARHQTLYRRLGESPEAVLEIVRQVKTIEPFLKLADSLTGRCRSRMPASSGPWPSAGPPFPGRPPRDDGYRGRTSPTPTGMPSALRRTVLRRSKFSGRSRRSSSTSNRCSSAVIRSRGSSRVRNRRRRTRSISSPRRSWTSCNPCPCSWS